MWDIIKKPVFMSMTRYKKDKISDFTYITVIYFNWYTLKILWFHKNNVYYSKGLFLKI